MRVLITDAIARECLQALSGEGIQPDYRTSLEGQELKEAIRDADGLIVRSGTKVTADLIESADKLKVIGRAGTGVDNIDVDAATARGIAVMNSPGGNSISTAEHTFALMLAFARNIHLAHHSLKMGKWDRKKYKGMELYGKTLGIIGFGRIGKEVAKRATAFGMTVKVFDPYVERDDAEAAGCLKSELSELLADSDIITVHIPLSPETRGMIGEKEIESMKQEAIIINCARGGIVDESALSEAVREGKIKGACLDVYEQEPPSGSPLCGADKICHTPHLAASTGEAQVRCGVEVARQVAAYLKVGRAENVINPSVLKERN